MLGHLRRRDCPRNVTINSERFFAYRPEWLPVSLCIMTWTSTRKSGCKGQTRKWIINRRSLVKDGQNVLYTAHLEGSAIHWAWLDVGDPYLKSQLYDP